jgi:hypothetical protein
MSITRRQFVKRSVAAAAAIPFVTASSVRGASEDIRVGVVGLGVRGAGTHIPRMERQKGVRVVAICDPDQERLGKTGENIE